MCGVFYVDDDTAREMEKLVRKVDAQLKQKRRTGDIRPTDIAAVISTDKEELIATPKKWGFPGFENQNVIINARAESVLEKRMFSDSVLKRRIVIPATGFYEWNPQREKVTFTPMQQRDGKLPILFMAGFYNHFEGEDRFIILTTSANDSVKDVHHRMPLVLEAHELEQWLFDDSKLDDFLHKVPMLLNKHQPYEQQKLMFN